MLTEREKDYIEDALRGFRQDPPASDFTRGYLMALREVAGVLGIGHARIIALSTGHQAPRQP